MERTRHCALCENEITSLKNGVTCRLTKKKPDFIKKCKDIKLNEKLQQKLVFTILDLERIRKFKINEYLIFCILLITGILIIIGSTVYAELWGSHSSYYWVHRVSAIAAGITILMYAFNELSSFSKKLKIAKSEKNKIDSILKEYKISYKTKLDYKEKIHGDQNIEITIEFKNLIKKQTTIMAAINTDFGY